MARPLLSIAIPSFNRGERLEALLRHVLETEGDFEVRVQLDGVEDDSAERLERIADDRFHVVDSALNRGRAQALKDAILACAGRFIMIFDDDDWLDAEGLRTVLQDLAAPLPEYVAGFIYSMRDESGQRIGGAFPVARSNLLSLRLDHGVEGDRKEVVRADLLQRSMRLVPEKARRVPTSTFWADISRDYDILTRDATIGVKTYDVGGMSDRIAMLKRQDAGTMAQLYRIHLDNFLKRRVRDKRAMARSMAALLLHWGRGGGAARVSEIVLGRVLPGLINLASLLIIAQLLGAGEYGFFSTQFATASFVGALLFAPLSQILVARFATHERAGEGASYEEQMIGGGLIVTLTLVAVAVLVAPLSAGWAAATGLAASLGLFTVLQQILRARLRFDQNAIITLGQAIPLVAVLLVTADSSTSPSTLLILFAFSYVFADLLALLLIARRPRLPSSLLRRDLKSFGLPSLAGVSSEWALQMGFRYGLLLFAPAALLGAFSLALDIAQRTIGIFVSLVAFAVVPSRMKAHSEGDERALGAALFRAAVVAGAVGLFAIPAILLVGQTGWVDALEPERLWPLGFAALGIATLVARLRKLALDPIAYRRERPGAIAWANLLALAAAIVLVPPTLWLFPEAVFFVYLATILLSAAFLHRLTRVAG